MSEVEGREGRWWLEVGGWRLIKCEERLAETGWAQIRLESPRWANPACLGDIRRGAGRHINCNHISWIRDFKSREPSQLLKHSLQNTIEVSPVLLS